MKPTGNTILITGGGSGIGQALARRFHALGNQVIVAGRRRDALDETIAGHDGMAAMVVDVEDPAAIATFADRLIADHPALNVVINNAGIMRSETLTGARDLADAEAMIVTNLLGPIRLTNALVDHLTRQPDPVIVNVTSGLAFVPMVSAPTYSATKAAIHSYTLSLRHQLHGQVEVIELAPPGVQTDLTPGQATRDMYMPLADYIDEVMGLFEQQPTPSEILVERVKMLRHAEAEGRFDQVMAGLNGAV
ncbi:oxidoreductase [Sphingomonas sp. Leaf339]|uniref:SDR family oxidoreductase n=1 Tax=Sphingomonas sp. Leaf339 TaxID=1736343 RepID=UPI0006F61AFF|nr:SDR family oxidoreductase [Sphingomonas sp. Leaf339]KQU49755.1 oxidoreductase [Sphingomonas sp. Leaf339]